MTDDEHKKIIELYRKQNENIINTIEIKKNNIKRKISNLNEGLL